MTEQETPRQRAARLRLEGRSMTEIGQELGISRQRVHQLTRDEMINVDLELTREQAKQLAERYEREHKEDESLPAWLRRLWIGEANGLHTDDR